MAPSLQFPEAIQRAAQNPVLFDRLTRLKTTSLSPHLLHADSLTITRSPRRILPTPYNRTKPKAIIYRQLWQGPRVRLPLERRPAPPQPKRHRPPRPRSLRQRRRLPPPPQRRQLPPPVERWCRLRRASNEAHSRPGLAKFKKPSGPRPRWRSTSRNLAAATSL